MSRSPLRVAVVGPVAPPYGGIARYVEDLLASRRLRRHHLVHVNTSFSRRTRSHAVNPGNKRYLADTGGIFRRHGYIFAGGVGQGIRTLVAGLWTVPRLAGVMASSSPDLVHVFANMHWGFWRASAVVLAARLARRRIIFHPLGAIDQFYPSCGPLGQALIRFSLDRADLILVQSPELARIVSAYTRRPVRGIFNGIDLAPFRAPRPAHSGAAVRFLSVGDLGQNKGTWDIVAAAGRVADRLPGATWNFIGRGDEDELQRRAGAAGIAGRVRVLGAVDEKERIAALEASDVFLLPSYGEGQPLSILEAMAAGLPVVSTRVGSIPEVLPDESHGILIDPGDVDGLGDAMLRLGQDAGLRSRMGECNARAARSRFDSERLWQEIEEAWIEACR